MSKHVEPISNASAMDAACDVDPDASLVVKLSVRLPPANLCFVTKRNRVQMKKVEIYVRLTVHDEYKYLMVARTKIKSFSYLEDY